MPYHYLDDIATADVAFEAWGESEAGMFRSAAEATIHVMVSDPETIELRQLREIELADEALDLLLLAFLQEVIFYKDADRLLLRVGSLRIEKSSERYILSAQLRGEPINRQKHDLVVDVKAVTMHRFQVEAFEGGWKATVILDI